MRPIDYGDLIGRGEALEAIKWLPVQLDAETVQRCLEAVSNLPSAQPETEEFEWCNDCKEYDQVAHCCHRWTKVIRNTVDELKRSTVDAIPVEWMRKFKETPVTDESAERCDKCGGDFVEWMILEWAERKEE